MPTDAKCGLLVGVGVVVAVAVLFFQKDPPAATPPPAAAVRAPAPSGPSDKTIVPPRPASVTTGRGP
jgi:hypothetical protein